MDSKLQFYPTIGNPHGLVSIEKIKLITPQNRGTAKPTIARWVTRLSIVRASEVGLLATIQQRLAPPALRVPAGVAPESSSAERGDCHASSVQEQRDDADDDATQTNQVGGKIERRDAVQRHETEKQRARHRP